MTKFFSVHDLAEGLVSALPRHFSSDKDSSETATKGKALEALSPIVEADSQTATGSLEGSPAGESKASAESSPETSSSAGTMTKAQRTVVANRTKAFVDEAPTER